MLKSVCSWVKDIGCVKFISKLLFMGGIELNPGPNTQDPDDTQLNLLSWGNVFTIPGSPTQFNTLQEAIAMLKIAKPTCEPISVTLEETLTHSPTSQDISDDTGHQGNTVPNIEYTTCELPNLEIICGQKQENVHVDTTNVTKLSSDACDGLQLQSESKASPITGKSQMLPLKEQELVEFSEYIRYESQERIAVMLGADLDRVETLRGKHRENVIGVSLDLLLDWMIINPQPTNRYVSNIKPLQDRPTPRVLEACS